jgi:hypothetical protein
LEWLSFGQQVLFGMVHYIKEWFQTFEEKQVIVHWKITAMQVDFLDNKCDCVVLLEMSRFLFGIYFDT